MHSAVAEVISGNKEAALNALRIGEQIAGPNPRAGVLSQAAYAYGRAGHLEDAQRMSARIEKLATEPHGPTVWSYNRAEAYLGIGDQESALKILQAMADNPGPHNGHYTYIAILARNLYSDPVLDQPEFVEVRKRLGFTDL